MYFWISCFCFISILKISLLIKSEEQNFTITATGHSGLLISWDPNLFEKPLESFFIITYQEFMKEIHYPNPKGVHVLNEQYQISQLNESTEYLINITFYENRQKMIKTYSIRGETSSKRNVLPTKPDFKFLYYDDSLVNGVGNRVSIHVIWLPCGQTKNCNGKEVGTHFSLQYKIFDSVHWINIGNVYDGYYSIDYIFPGTIYEIIISSVNGNFLTESDSKEAFYDPISSPVQSVKIIQLLNTSVLLSWKRPRHSVKPISEYSISYRASQISRNTEHYHYSNSMDSYPIWKYELDKYNCCEMKLSNLKPATTYTFTIIPTSRELIQSSFGFGYSIEYVLRPIQRNNHLTVPELAWTYKVKQYAFLPNHCYLCIEWFHCGQQNDCKSIKPWSAFKLQIKNKKTGRIIYNSPKEEPTSVYYTYVQKRQILNVTLTSFDEHNNSKTNSTIIEIEC